MSTWLRIPCVPGSKKRTKESVAEVRHLYLDLDTDGETRLAELRSSNSVPIPTAIVSTSPGKYQVLWRVEGFAFAQQESTLKVLAITFGGDPACTDCNRVLRLPGFLNQKYDPAHPVTVEYRRDSISHPEDFRLDIQTLKGELLRGPIGPGKPNGKALAFRAGLGMGSRGISPREGPGQTDSNAWPNGVRTNPIPSTTRNEQLMLHPPGCGCLKAFPWPT